MQYSWISPNAFRHRRRRGKPPAKNQKGGGTAPIKTAKEPRKTIGSNHVLGGRRKEDFLIIMNQKGVVNILIGVVIVVVVIGAAGYFYWTQRVTTPVEQIQTTNTPPQQQTSPPSGNASSQTPPTASNTTNWKTYQNQIYGFELKYPPNLAVKFVATTTMDQIAQFHVHDPHFDFNDKVGQEIRTSYDEVMFTIYSYTKESFAQKIKEYQSGIKEWNNELPKETIVKSQSGDIKVYELHSGLVGPYLQGHFHNDKYIFEISAIFHDELADDILSTFKFTK